MKQQAGFQSFWMAGFEAASHINRFHSRVDMIASTHHDTMAGADYAMLSRFGMKTVRDAFRWHLIDRGNGKLDFSSVVTQLAAAAKERIQVIWSLFHYGIPDGLDIFSPEFVERFVSYSLEALKLIREFSDDPPYLVPMNEISFFSWAATRQCMFPFAEGRDAELKRQIARAAIQACFAMRAADSRCRFVFPEPLIHVIPPRGRPDLEERAKELNASQFESWDMIAGTKDPELGGSADLLDILGMNFYHSNQWEIEGERLDWAQTPRDVRWQPLSLMMETVWNRYRRPLFLAETSHVGSGRAEWIREVAEQTLVAIHNGVPVEGICLFPIIDRFDWENREHWHNSGLWDLDRENSMSRVLNEPYSIALEYAQKFLPIRSGIQLAHGNEKP